MDDTGPEKTIHSARLLLRQWQPEDLEPLVSMSNDPRVMEFFPAFHSRDDCEAMMARMIAHHRERNFGYWAV